MWAGASMVEATAIGLEVDPPRRKGRDGYIDHRPIRTAHGADAGFIAAGGNGDTVHLSLSGQGCARVDFVALGQLLAASDYTISRLDAAWDDWTGEYITPRGAVDAFRAGAFKPFRGPQSPSHRFVDDLGSGQGSTFYLGSRQSSLLRIYDKDAEQGIEGQRVRVEVQLSSSAFALGWDHVLAPGSLLLQRPGLAHLPIPPDGDLERLTRFRRHAEELEFGVALERAIAHAERQTGKLLRVLRDALSDAEILDLLSAPSHAAVPRTLRRFYCSAEELANQIRSAIHPIAQRAAAAR